MLLALAGCTAPAPQQQACSIDRQAVLPFQIHNGELRVAASIAGRTVSLILDTGSQNAVITEQGARKLNLPPDPSGGTTTIIGTSGTIRVPRVLLRRLELGGYEFPPQIVPVAQFGRPNDPDPPDGLIGAEILAAFDVELDFPSRTISLYEVQNCTGRFLPWGTRYTAVPMIRTARNLLELPVALDGHRLTALFDTGAAHGRVNLAAAETAGLDPAVLAEDRPDQERGVGGNLVPSRLHRFSTLRVGADGFRNIELAVAEHSIPEADMLLGLPYMAGRHLWLSYSTSQLFVEEPGR